MYRRSTPSAVLLAGLLSALVVPTVAPGVAAASVAAQPDRLGPVTRAPSLPPPKSPFAHCPDQGYQVHLPAGERTSTLGYFDIATSKFYPIKNLGIGVNAIGYSQTQNVFWAVNASPRNADRVIRIDSAGNVDDIGQPYDSSGPVAVQTVTGAVQNDRFYLHNKIDNHLLVIDIKPGSPTLGKVLNDVALSRVTPGGGNTFLTIGDWDFNALDGQLYSIEMQGPRYRPSTKRVIVKINPATGRVTDVADLTAQLPDGRNYGAVYVENSSNVMYVSNNDVNRTREHSQTFGIKSFDPPEVIAYQPGQPLDVNDGADCLLATDYGDAPESYRTLHQDGGPAHVITVRGDDDAQLTIGNSVDAEPNGIPSKDVDGDDRNGPDANDEDGVSDGTRLDPGAPKLTVPVVNTTGKLATLAGWLDLNRNGSFDRDERAVAAVAPNATSATLTWSMTSLALGEAPTLSQVALPSLALRAGPTPAPDHVDTYLRLRLYPGAVIDPQPVGAEFVVGGEMEDHLVSFDALPTTGPSLTILLLVGVGLVLCGGFTMALARRQR